MTKIILDFEYNQGFIIKELAYININDPINLHHFIIRSSTDPDKDVKQNAWIYHNLHAIPYNYGLDINIKHILEKIPSNSKIYVQGVEKMHLISRYLPTCHVINLLAPSHLKLYQPYKQIQCPYPHSGLHCAVIKVYKFYSYFKSAPLI